MEEETWDAEVMFLDGDEPGGRATGAQVNTMRANRHRMDNDFRIAADGQCPACDGHGNRGSDPLARTYVNLWVDTNDHAPRTDYRFRYEPQNARVWSSKLDDARGHFVGGRITEEFRRATRTFTFFPLGLATPNPHALVKIVFTKRKVSPSAT
jgi:hypothetical protein